MKISQKLVILFLVVSIIPIIAIGAFAEYNTQRALKNEISSQIEAILTSQTNEISGQVTQDEQVVGVIADNGNLQILQNAYVNAHSAATAQQLSALLTSLQQSNQAIRRIYVASNKGIIEASSDPRFIGKNYRNTKVFQAGIRGVNVSIFFNDIDGVERQYLTAPIIVNGQTTLGVVIIEYQIYSYSFITDNYLGLGSTGETFITGPDADSKSINLLPLRFNPQAALTINALRVSGPDPRSYRNHPVLIKTARLSGVPWTVGVMMDQAEAYAPAVQLRNIILATMGTTIVLTFILGWYSSSYITAPIKRMTNIVTRIRQGDLTLEVDAQTNDEIGILGSAFNELKTNLIEAEARLRASVGSLPFGFAVIDTQDKLVFHNKSFELLTNHGIPQSQNDSTKILKQIDSDYGMEVGLLDCIHKTQSSGKILEENIEVGPKFFRLLFVPVINPVGTIHEVTGCVLIIEDTTDKKAAERSRDEFFSIASHELRTPLTAIRGNTSMILKFYPDLLKDESLKQMVDDIFNSSTRLIDIVNDFLDSSRLEQGRAKFNKQPCDISALIEQTLREYEVTGSRRKLSLTYEPPSYELPHVMIDKDRTRQIMINLIGNGIKFTEKGGITLRAALKGEVVKVTVSDTGKGIPLASQHLLFRKFQQASNNILTRDNTQSTGLGLYISKMLAEAMGGKLYLEKTEEGKGSTFALELCATDDPLPSQNITPKVS